MNQFNQETRMIVDMKALNRPKLTLKRNTGTVPVPEPPKPAPKAEPPKAQPQPKPPKARFQPKPVKRDWREDELARKEQLDQGLAVFASHKKDAKLIEYGRKRKRTVFISRKMRWGCKYSTLDGSGLSMADCLSRYITDFEANSELKAQLPTLRGKIIVCKCTSPDCHARWLVTQANIGDNT